MKVAALVLGTLLATASNADSIEAPLCTPFASPPGRWTLTEQDGRLQPERWVPADEDAVAAGNVSAGPPCRWLTPTPKDFAECMRDGTVVLTGDSITRYAWIFTGQDMLDCPPEPSDGPCLHLSAMRECKCDGKITTPVDRGNLTYVYKYLRFGYEMLDTFENWPEGFMTRPGAVDAVIVGGILLWDVRYRLQQVLYNVLEALPFDLPARFFASGRVPGLQRRIVALSSGWSENWDSRMGMFPHDLLEEGNAHLAQAWPAAGIPFFDMRKYVKADAPELKQAMAKNGGRVLTMDGFHPTKAVQLATAREWMSHVCAQRQRQLARGDDGPVIAPGSGSSSGRSHDPQAAACNAGVRGCGRPAGPLLHPLLFTPFTAGGANVDMALLLVVVVASGGVVLRRFRAVAARL